MSSSTRPRLFNVHIAAGERDRSLARDVAAGLGVVGHTVFPWWNAEPGQVADDDHVAPELRALLAAERLVVLDRYADANTAFQTGYWSGRMRWAYQAPIHVCLTGGKSCLGEFLGSSAADCWPVTVDEWAADAIVLKVALVLSRTGL